MAKNCPSFNLRSSRPFWLILIWLRISRRFYKGNLSRQNNAVKSMKKTLSTETKLSRRPKML